MTTIFFLMLVSTAIIFSSLTLNMNYTAIAQQQEQPIINDPKLQAEIFLKGSYQHGIYR